MQNPPVNAPNRGICYKLSPQIILGWGRKFWGLTICPGRTLCPRGNPFALGQSSAPEATPKPLAQTLCPWGNPYWIMPMGQPKGPG